MTVEGADLAALLGAVGVGSEMLREVADMHARSELVQPA